ncbi:MAG: DNA polymerase/3'-5' exonuclease PolX [Patescibacteria group bacterium]|nr:DNA polymerase/3'-5' exonuclease PolX [Patescibacteria group bacterium]
MKNLELSQIFYQMSDLLEIKEAPFRARAFRKAGRVFKFLEKDVEEIYREGGTKALKDIPGVGEGIARRIEEFIKTGNIKDYQKLKKKCPVDLESLSVIEGIGSKKIKFLYKELKIKNRDDLKKAAQLGRIRKLEGFGAQSEKNILQAIAFAKAGEGRFLLGLILPRVRRIINKLKKLPQVGKISAAGSVRRGKESVGDVDILVASSEPKEIMDFFTKIPGISKVWAKGATKSSIRFRDGLDCDLRIVKKESFGAALQYFTGSKEHNILTRRIARKKGLKLNEYGVYKGKRKIAGQTEKGVYKAIGLPYIEPELRTNTGEIEAALSNNLPKLINYNDIKGDCHCHTDWSDGSQTIEQMANVAKKMGYQYLAITDHGGFLKIANALDEKRLLKQMAEIDKINKRVSGIEILKGCEVDIKKNGDLAIKDEVLAKLDLVLAAVHSNYKMAEKDMTERLVRAIENPFVNIIAHPTGRKIHYREEYSFDFDKIFKAARENKTALEINSHPKRLDLRDIHIKKALEAEVKLVINTDAHNSLEFSMIELGIATARRGWAKKKDILNTRPVNKFLEYFGD